MRGHSDAHMGAPRTAGPPPRLAGLLRVHRLVAVGLGLARQAAHFHREPRQRAPPQVSFRTPPLPQTTGLNQCAAIAAEVQVDHSFQMQWIKAERVKPAHRDHHTSFISSHPSAIQTIPYSDTSIHFCVLPAIARFMNVYAR